VDDVDFEADRIERILALHLHGLGNALMFTPALRALAAAFPRARITVIAGPGGATEVIERTGLARVITLDRDAGLAELAALALRIRRMRPDLAISTGQIIDRKAPIMAAASGAPRRLGPTNFPLGRLYNAGCSISAGEHYVERDLRLLAEIGVRHADEVPRFDPAHEDTSRARKALEESGIDLTRPLVGLCFQTPWIPQKAWPFESVVALAREIVRSLGAQVALVGNAAPGDRNEEIAAAVGRSCAVLTRELSSVSALAGLLSLCNVFASADSGPAHLAAAVGTPTVTLFGPTDPRSCRPLSPNAVIIQGRCPHAPCYPAHCRRERLVCMESIRVEDVLEAVANCMETTKGIAPVKVKVLHPLPGSDYTEAE